MKTYNVTIQGTAPLLQHRYQFKDELAASTTKKSGSVDYSEEWKRALYWNPETGLYQPAAHIEGALIKASTNFQITGRGKKTYRDLIKSTVFVSPDTISYGYGNLAADALLANGKIQIHRAVCVVQKSRVERLRPMLPIGWELSFDLQTFDEQVPMDALREILDYAGKFVGLGDYRPRFGRFMVKHFE